MPQTPAGLDYGFMPLNEVQIKGVDVLYSVVKDEFNNDEELKRQVVALVQSGLKSDALSKAITHILAPRVSKMAADLNYPLSLPLYGVIARHIAGVWTKAGELAVDIDQELDALEAKKLDVPKPPVLTAQENINNLVEVLIEAGREIEAEATKPSPHNKLVEPTVESMKDQKAEIEADVAAWAAKYNVITPDNPEENASVAAANAAKESGRDPYLAGIEARNEQEDDSIKPSNWLPDDDREAKPPHHVDLTFNQKFGTTSEGMKKYLESPKHYASASLPNTQTVSRDEELPPGPINVEVISHADKVPPESVGFAVNFGFEHPYMVLDIDAGTGALATHAASQLGHLLGDLSKGKPRNRTKPVLTVAVLRGMMEIATAAHSGRVVPMKGHPDVRIALRYMIRLNNWKFNQ